MKKLLPFALALSLLTPLAHADKKTEAAKEKPAATEPKPAAAETKPAATATKKTDKKTTEKKPAATTEPSESDKALLADAKKEADALTDAQRTKVMELLNTGDAKALQAVDGIGEVRAKNLIAKRPFAKVEDAAMVDGVGIETFKNLIATATGAPKAEKPKTEKPKTDPKMTEKPKAKTEKPAAKPAKVAPAAPAAPAGTEPKPDKKEATPAKKP